ncbi:MAG TPA: AI-2E family transporter [Thermoguttaceae bacterium]|nr:AI-2E family transporter [Thermoguttaceae bacterium]
MARVVSFVVLVVILLAIAALFFMVMANFLLPMFLAVLLVIIFGPVHQWMLLKCKERVRVAAGLTTGAILLILIIPMLLILLPAGVQAHKVYRVAASKSIPLAAMVPASGADEDCGEPSALDLRTLSETLAANVADFANNRFAIGLTTDEIEATINEKVKLWVTPLALGTTQFLGRSLIGLGVMVISLYYFLADGPAMIRTIMRLSPLDDKYEQQLIDKFADTTRSVVLATLLSAFAQGILAGIGFYFAGLSYVSLLMAAAMLFAMVPFIGTTIVWVPACLWLYWSPEGSTFAAVVLAIYCIAFVSMADNVIKPLVLHGRANLHPLLALLSVLGGVQALGPIGIFIGPMVVVFLHALLNMLNTELNTMGNLSPQETG